MNPLEQAKAILLQKIQNEDVSKEVPKHNAFEVEDCNTRQNYVFLNNENSVTCFDTSRGAGDVVLFQYPDAFGEFPELDGVRFANADEYYNHLFRKSLNFVGNIGFLGYVDPKTFEPLEE